MTETCASASLGIHSAALHAVIFCWPGKEGNARHIARSLIGHVDHLTVIYKNHTGRSEEGCGDWERVPGHWFYGRLCKRSFDLFRGAVLLQIQADALFQDWPRLASRCRDAFGSVPGLGIWAPNVFYSAHPPELTQLSTYNDDQLIVVSRTDAIVWALARPVVDLLRPLNYAANNLGWGIDDAAAAFARSRGMLVLTDLSLSVEHPKGSGYEHAEAIKQRKIFISNLRKSEIDYVEWIEEEEHRRRTFNYRQRRNFRLLLMFARRLSRALARALFE